MRRALLLLWLIPSAAAQSIMISGSGHSIAVSGSAAVGAQVEPEKPVSEPFKEVASPPPKFVEPPAAKPTPRPAPAPAAVSPPAVRRVTQNFLIVTSGCPACPAAKARFEAAGNPRENIISPSEAMRRFGVSTSYVPYEFSAAVDVQTQASRQVQSAPARRQRLPVVNTQWGRIDLETYNRNCNCSMCAGIRALQQQYRSYQPTSFVPEPVENLPADQQPTPQLVIEDMISLMGLNSSDVVGDIGCGDGRILIAAVQKYGCRGVGVEIDAQQADRARMAVESAGLSDRIQIITGDARAFNPQTYGITAITVYLFPELLKQLAPKLKYARVVASAFHDVPGLDMTRRGDVWIYRKSAPAVSQNVVQNVTIPGFHREDEIDHLMDPSSQHAGRFTRTYLSSLSDMQLIDLHNREHGVVTRNGERIAAR